MNRSNTTRILAIVAFGVLLFCGLLNFDRILDFIGLIIGLLAPFLTGLCIAFILNVPLRAIEQALFPIEKRKKKARSLYSRAARPVSITLTLLAFFAVIAIVLFLVIPELGNTFTIIRDGFPAFLERMQQWSEALIKRIPELTGKLESFQIDWAAIGAKVGEFLQSGAGTVLNSTVNVATSIFSGLFNFVMGMIFAVYLLMQKEKLGVQVRRLLVAFLPQKRAEHFISICRLSQKTFSNFLTGQCLEAVILGSMFFIAMAIFRFPYALMISVLIAVTALIPIFGAFIGLVIGAFLILVANPIQALWFVVMFLIIQQIEGNLIYPRVVGSSVGLPSLWVLVAVTLGGSTMGILGMLINVPLCSVIYCLLRQSVNRRLKQKKQENAREEGQKGSSHALKTDEERSE